ncbi:PHP domain-containing protein [Treponema sp. TIM-1]|uniref:PHP domain-containing protein n=1 Tax=Treponema sp. TIM-1 TaxID=2898417 RepID=UPI00397F929C
MKDPIAPVNDPRIGGEERLAALKDLEGKNPGIIKKTGEINNHIHTIYSFSPYTPCMAAFKARDAGLEAAGSVDHDSIAAAEEMLAACAVLGIGGCVGFEVRVSFKTGPDGKPGPFAHRKINNPDSEGLVYMTVQGIPRPAIPVVRDFLKPIQAERLLRTRAMTASANELFREAGLPPLDFEEDIWNRSKAAEGGGITERHLLAAMAEKLIQTDGKGPALAEKLKTRFGLEPSPKIAGLLGAGDNPHYLFDLIGVLKSGLLPRIFIQPGEKECIPAEKVTEFACSIGAIPAYAYLGDVGESPTGDKRAEKFEDSYIEELFDELVRRGYQALTYMPPRNTREQLLGLQKLCREQGFMEISGVDINSSRQSFNCPEVLFPEFRHLTDTTWALIAHERLASVNPALGLFSPANPLAAEPLGKRLARYAAEGRSLDLLRPEESAAKIAARLMRG